MVASEAPASGRRFQTGTGQHNYDGLGKLVNELFQEILNLRSLGVTVLLVEQNAIAALQVADRAYVMENGEFLLEGQASDLLYNPEVKRAYLGKGYKEVWE